MRRLDARVAAYLIAAILALSFSYDLMRKPVQVSDSLMELLDVQVSPSVFATFVAHTPRGPFVRPLKQVQTKLLFDMSGGQYTLAFRLFHALLLTAAIVLFTRALRVRTWTDFAAAVFAVTVLTGHHTFRGTVREAFPINFYLENVVFCLIMLNLAQSRGGWKVDLAAALTFVLAALNAESGVLVCVVAVAAWAGGLRGISPRGVVVVVLLLGAYMALRFSLSIGTPGLDVGRDSGFGIRMLQTDELVRRFGDDPKWFYLYNVATQMLSVLFADPDRGVFHTVRTWYQGRMPARLYVAVVPSVMTTALIGWAVAARLRGRAQQMREASDQYFILFAVMLVANCAVSYAYAKHEIIIPAGTFYAFAAFAAARYAVEYLQSDGLPAERMQPAPAFRIACCVLLGALASAWAFRSAGVHHMLQTQAFKERVEWARLDPDKLADRGYRSDASARALATHLRRDALDLRIANPRLLPGWADDWWGE